MRKNKRSGIYKIENILNHDTYIGQSVNLYGRRDYHFSALKNQNHINAHLQRAYNKYGYKNLVFTIILYCEPYELTYYEQKIVDMIRPRYNIRIDCVDSNKGISPSEESRKKISESLSGDKSPNFGNHPSRETREKMSSSQKNKKMPEHYGKNLSKRISGENHPMYGKHHTEESKKKMSDANKGRKLSDETKMKMSNARKGIPRSEETKRKISETLKNKKKNKKNG